MMELVFSDSAKKELENLPQDMKAIFLIHLEKIHSRTPGKHMKHGILCHVLGVLTYFDIVFQILLLKDPAPISPMCEEMHD